MGEHQVRDIDRNKPAYSFQVDTRNASPPLAFISPDGEIVAVWDEPDLTFHDVSASDILYNFSFGLQEHATALAFSANAKRFIIGFSDANAVIFDPRQKKSLIPLTSMVNPYKSVGIYTGGMRVIAQEFDNAFDMPGSLTVINWTDP